MRLPLDKVCEIRFDIEMWKWRCVDMETWKWRCVSVDVEICGCGYAGGDVDVEVKFGVLGVSGFGTSTIRVSRGRLHIIHFSDYFLLWE